MIVVRPQLVSLIKRFVCSREETLVIQLFTCHRVSMETIHRDMMTCDTKEKAQRVNKKCCPSDFPNIFSSMISTDAWF